MSEFGLRPEPVLGRRLKTSERLARRIARDIIDANLPEGTPLPIEQEMAARYSVGRTTLREAMRILESRGAISIRAGSGGGPAVRRPRPSDLADSLELFLQFERVTLTDVLKARIAIESTAVSLAAARITDEELEALQETVEEIRANSDNHRRFLEANAAFHRLAVESSGSRVLHYFGESLKHVADGAVAGITYGKRRRLAVADAHESIIEALRRRDPAGAEQAMRAHLDDAAAYWGKYYAEVVRKPIEWGPE